MDAPARAKVGETIDVSVMTMARGKWVDGRLVAVDPGLALPRRLSLTIVDPAGNARTLLLGRSPRPQLQSRRLVLGRAGTWELSVRPYRYGSCAAEQRVEVG